MHLSRARRGASASERCRPALWRNVLSIVRKSRNSSSGLYRCRRRSAYDRHRTNAMRFLMKTIVIRPPPRLIHAFRQKNLSGCAWALAAVFVSLPKPRSRHSRLLARHNYTLNLLAPVQSCFSKLLARQHTHPKSLTPSSVPHRARYFSQTLIHVRGRLRPTIE